jgi:hypothetical protein
MMNRGLRNWRYLVLNEELFFCKIVMRGVHKKFFHV